MTRSWTFGRQLLQHWRPTSISHFHSFSHLGKGIGCVWLREVAEQATRLMLMPRGLTGRHLAAPPKRAHAVKVKTATRPRIRNPSLFAVSGNAGTIGADGTQLAAIQESKRVASRGTGLLHPVPCELLRMQWIAGSGVSTPRGRGRFFLRRLPEPVSLRSARAQYSLPSHRTGLYCIYKAPESALFELECDRLICSLP